MHGPGYQGNRLHTEYFAFLRKVYKHTTSIKNLRPKVACSLTRGLQWNSMHSQIWTSEDNLLFWGGWTLFNLKNSFPVLLFQSKNWTVSKRGKLCSSCSYQWNFSTDKKARVWLNFEQNARVGPISLRGFSGWLWNLLTDDTSLLTDDTSFLLFFFRELVFRLRMGWKISLSAIGFGFISYQNQPSQKSSYRNSSLSNEHFCITVSVLSRVRSTGSFQGRMRNSSNLQWAEKRSRQQFKSQFMRKEGSSCLRKSHMSKRGAKSSSNLEMWARKGARVCKFSNDEQYEHRRKLMSANLQWASKMIFSA